MGGNGSSLIISFLPKYVGRLQTIDRTAFSETDEGSRVLVFVIWQRKQFTKKPKRFAANKVSGNDF